MNGVLVLYTITLERSWFVGLPVFEILSHVTTWNILSHFGSLIEISDNYKFINFFGLYNIDFNK